jgi:hypothetical protein
MFMMLDSIVMLFLTQWLFKQELGGPLSYWLLGYFTASFLASSLVLLVLWLSRRTPRPAKPLPVVSVTKEMCETKMSSATSTT